jgi:K+-sensing histidine kinase KdpD
VTQQIALDLLPDAVLVLSADRTLVAANEAARALLGPRLDEAVGRPVGEALEVRSAGGAPALRDSLPTNGEVELTFRGAHDDDVQVAATCRAGDDGAVLCLRPSGERSGIAVISTVSHELRSPLTSVKGYTSLMLSRWARLRDDQKITMLEQVHHDADRVTRLVTELLDISRLETGRLVLRRQMVDLAAIAASVVEKVGLTTPELSCELRFPEAFPSVYADPDKVEQVITNLIENAVKYGSPTGMVVEGQVGSEGFVAVAVTDTGPGIPDEDLPRVFTKFFRRDHGRPTGTGLGLWISRGLVEAHGGELTATSQPAAGATFRFTLPTDAFEQAHGE